MYGRRPSCIYHPRKLYCRLKNAIGELALFRPVLLLIALILASSGLQAQDCVPGLINLSSQAEVDAFQDNHGPCTQVTVELDIGGFDIVSLQGLAPLAGVSGYLNIDSSPSLGSLHGLDALSSVHALLLTGLHGLSDLSGLGSLDEVSIMLHINDSDGMVNLSGLPASMTELHTLFLQGNDGLSSLAGFPSVSNAMSLIALVGNSALTSLSGMPASLSSLETLSIVSNDSLSSLDGLSAISSLEQDLGITANPALASLTGLSNTSFSEQDPTNPRQSIVIGGNGSLASLDGIPVTTQLVDLEVTDNTSLTSLAPLQGVQEVWGGLFISGNTSLTDCSVLQKIFDDVDDGPPGPGPKNPGDPPDIENLEDVFIADNGPGCNSIEEILQAPPDPLIFENGFESGG